MCVCVCVRARAHVRVRVWRARESKTVRKREQVSGTNTVILVILRIVAPQTGTLPTIMLIRDFWFPNKYVHSCVKGFVGTSVQERTCARAAGDCYTCRAINNAPEHHCESHIFRCSHLETLPKETVPQQHPQMPEPPKHEDHNQRLEFITSVSSQGLDCYRALVARQRVDDHRH